MNIFYPVMLHADHLSSSPRRGIGLQASAQMLPVGLEEVEGEGEHLPQEPGLSLLACATETDLTCFLSMSCILKCLQERCFEVSHQPGSREVPSRPSVWEVWLSLISFLKPNIAKFLLWAPM